MNDQFEQIYSLSKNDEEYNLLLMGLELKLRNGLLTGILNGATIFHKLKPYAILLKLLMLKFGRFLSVKGSSDEQNLMLEHISEDFSKHINIAIETVRKQYITYNGSK